MKDNEIDEDQGNIKVFDGADDGNGDDDQQHVGVSGSSLVCIYVWRKKIQCSLLNVLLVDIEKVPVSIGATFYKQKEIFLLFLNGAEPTS